MGGPASDLEKRVVDRVDVNRSVQLRFDKFQEFLTEIAGNISPGGMFVRSDDPHEPGEQFEFECSLADGFPLVSGRAEVVWVRRASTTASEASGMGVRFVHLRDRSEELIRRIVEERLKAGEEPFQLESESHDSRLSSQPEPEPESDSVPAGLKVSEEIFAATERLVEEEPDQSTPESASGEPELEWIAAEEVASRVPRADPGKRIEPSTPSTEHPEARSVSPAVNIPEARPSLRPVAPPQALRELTPAPAAVPVPPVAAVAGKPRRRPPRLAFRRLLELVLFSILTGACMVLLFNQYWVRPRVERLEASLEELTGSSRVGGPPGSKLVAERAEPQAVAADGAADLGETSTAPVTATGPRPSTERARQTVLDWAKAWSEQRVDDYLSFYASDFTPASGLPRAAWEARRRDRLLRQGVIRVSVVALDVEELSANELQLAFTQSYQSDTFRDRVRKNLRMVWQDGAWKIAEETVIRQLPW